MKKYILYLLIVLLKSFPCFSQVIINNPGTVTVEAIKQIYLPEIDDFLTFQNLNQNVSNYVQIQQTGNSNSASFNQQKSPSFEESNQSYSVQYGNSNELTLGQIGSGNLFLGFQLNYISNILWQEQAQQSLFHSKISSTIQNSTEASNYIIVGDRNKMAIIQEGNNNGIMVVQQGSDNSISAFQKGNNNYLLTLQKGSNNLITDYRQENISGQNLFDRVIQIGDNLSFKSDEVSKSSLTGNTFMQTGTNLSFELNSDLINTAGGINVKQTGKDMKVVIDQSYFSFPLK